MCGHVLNQFAVQVWADRAGVYPEFGNGVAADLGQPCGCPRRLAFAQPLQDEGTSSKGQLVSCPLVHELYCLLSSMLLVFNIPVFDGDDLFLGFKRPDQRTDFIGSDIAGYQASDPSSHGQHKFKLLSLARQSAPHLHPMGEQAERPSELISQRRLRSLESPRRNHPRGPAHHLH